MQSKSNLIATRPLRYNAQALAAEAEFYAKPADAKVLVALGRARLKEDDPPDTEYAEVEPRPVVKRRAAHKYTTRHLTADE